MEAGRLRQAGMLGQTVRQVYGDAPRNGGWVPIQLLVEEVPPPSDRLPQRQSWCGYVEPGEQIQLVPPRIDEGSEDAPCHGPEDAEAALAYQEDLHGVLTVVLEAPYQPLRAGDDMIESSSNQTKDDDQDQPVPDMIRVLAPSLGLNNSHGTANEDANDDDDAVPVDG